MEKINHILETEKIINPEEFGISVMVAFGYRKEEPGRPQIRQTFETVVETI